MTWLWIDYSFSYDVSVLVVLIWSIFYKNEFCYVVSYFLYLYGLIGSVYNQILFVSLQYSVDHQYLLSLMLTNMLSDRNLRVLCHQCIIIYLYLNCVEFLVWLFPTFLNVVTKPHCSHIAGDIVLWLIQILKVSICLTKVSVCEFLALSGFSINHYHLVIIIYFAYSIYIFFYCKQIFRFNCKVVIINFWEGFCGYCDSTNCTFIIHCGDSWIYIINTT